MSLQDRFFPIVRQVASAFPHLLQINTYASCCEFTQRCLMAFGDPDWGHVSKTESEGQFTPPGFTARNVVGVDGHTYRITGVSHDAIFHRSTNQIVDLLGNGSANSDPDVSIHGDARIQWAEIPQNLNRVNNPWLPAIPVAGSTPSTPAAPSGIPAYPSNEADVDDAGAKLFADFASAGQAPNPQMFRFAFRTAFDWLSRSEPSIAASVAKHRAEWRGLLGLPPL